MQPRDIFVPSSSEMPSNSDPTTILPFPTDSNDGENILGNHSPELLLVNCVKPVVLLTKVVGLFPMQMKANGSIRHKWFSKEILYSLIYIGGFCATSALYLPFVYETTLQMNREQGVISFVSELVFFMGQYVASVITLLLNQWMAPRVAHAWNQIRDVTAYFGSKRRNARDLYKVTFIITRALFVAWIIFEIGYIIFFCFYFWKHLSIHFKKDSSSYFTFYVLGYILFCGQMSGHLLYIIVGGTFLRMLEHSLVGLRKIVPTEANDLDSFLKLYNTYCFIENVIKGLNTTFGAYTIVQIIVMVSSTLVNSYFTIYFQHGRHRGFIMIMPPLLVIMYSLWLLRVCNSGERIQNQSKKVIKALQHAAVFQLSRDDNVKVTGILGKLTGSQMVVTAAGFIQINRRLMAKVIVTMTTYLIILVQIRVEMKTAEDEPGDEYEDATTSTTATAAFSVFQNLTAVQQHPKGKYF